LWCINHWLYCSSPLSRDTIQYSYLIKTAIGTSHFLLCRDFYYRYPCINWINMTCNSSYTLEFIYTVQDLYLYQHITEFTRYKNGSTPHTLDLVFSNEEGMESEISYFSGLRLSDHVCICFNLNCHYSPRKTHSNLKYNLYKADYSKMRNILTAIDWNQEFAHQLSLKPGTSFPLPSIKWLRSVFLLFYQLSRKISIWHMRHCTSEISNTDYGIKYCTSWL